MFGSFGKAGNLGIVGRLAEGHRQVVRSSFVMLWGWWTLELTQKTVLSVSPLSFKHNFRVARDYHANWNKCSVKRSINRVVWYIESIWDYWSSNCCNSLAETAFALGLARSTLSRRNGSTSTWLSELSGLESVIKMATLDKCVMFSSLLKHIQIDEALNYS